MADYNPSGRARIERTGIQRGGPLPQGNPVDSTFEQDVRETMKELGDLLISKHRDYGPKNISDSPGGALNGLRVRMHDKTARINNLIDKARKAGIFLPNLQSCSFCGLTAHCQFTKEKK